MSNVIERINRAMVGMGTRNTDDYGVFFSEADLKQISDHIEQLKDTGRKLKAHECHLRFAIGNLCAATNQSFHDLLGKAIAISREPQPGILVEYDKSRHANWISRSINVISMMEPVEGVIKDNGWTIGLSSFLELSRQLEKQINLIEPPLPTSYEADVGQVDFALNQMVDFKSLSEAESKWLTVSEQVEIAERISAIEHNNLMQAARNAHLGVMIANVESGSKKQVKCRLDKSMEAIKLSLAQSFTAHNIESTKTLADKLLYDTVARLEQGITDNDAQIKSAMSAAYVCYRAAIAQIGR